MGEYIFKGLLYAKAVCEFSKGHYHYYIPLMSGYVCDHAASPKILVNALKSLASGKKSIEWSITTDPQQTS